MTAVLRHRLHEERYERFLYWIMERMAIYVRRRKGTHPPWTTDEVLHNNFFTTPFREMDKTTAWFSHAVRDPLKDHPEVLFATAAFRWFNWPATGELLQEHNLFEQWDYDVAHEVLFEQVMNGVKIFTSGYIIKVENGVAKYESVCNQLEDWWINRQEHIDAIEEATTLEDAWKYIKAIKYLGGFMAYEIVCDLRHTYFLRDAMDIKTWCHTGPGAIRGLMRLRGEPPHELLRSAIGIKSSLPGSREDCLYLIKRVPKDLMSIMKGKKVIRNPRGAGYKTRFYKPPEELTRTVQMQIQGMEMRTIEHSLCEFDKYERVLNGEGASKRKYSPLVMHAETDDIYRGYGG